MKREKLLNRYKLNYFTALIFVLFIFSGCGGSDDGGGSILMSSVGQSGADIAGAAAPAGSSFQAPARPGQPQNNNPAKNSGKNTIFLDKTSDEIAFISAPAVYDLSQIKVTAPNPAGKPIDRTSYPHTEWTLISGLGALNGTQYSSPAPETVLFKAVYKHGGDIETADFTLKIVGLDSISLDKYYDNLILVGSGETIYDLASIAVTANYSDGTSKDITNDAATICTINSGAGILSAKKYAAPATPEIAVFTVSFTQASITKTALFTLTTIDNTPPAVVISDNHPDAVVENGDTLIITASFTENGAMGENPPPAITIGEIVTGAPMTKINNFYWVYTWTVSTDKTGIQTVSIDAFDMAGNRNAPATGKTAYEIKSAFKPAVNYQYAAAWTGIIYTSGVAVDVSGNIYATGADHTVKKFAQSGSLITKWGSYGQQPGKFYNPAGIACSPSGHIFVADQYNNRIQKFDSNGNYILHWGSPGPGNGQFSYQFGISTDRFGSVLVADTYNCRIQKFDSDGNFILKFGSYGSGPGQFINPIGVCSDSNGNIYVSDSGNHRIQKFDSNGNYLSHWGGPGTEAARFNVPSGMAFDGNDYLYVADHHNNRIQKFDLNGNFITQFGNDAGLRRPHGVALDYSGGVYTADSYNHRVVKFRPLP